MPRRSSAITGMRVTAGDFDTDRVPPHLRMHFAVADDSGRIVARADSLPELQQTGTPAAPKTVSRNLYKTWTADGLGSLAEQMMQTAKGGAGEDKLRSERDYLGKAIEDVQGMVENLAMTALGSMDPKNDPKSIYKVGLNTTRFLLSAGDLVIGWLLLRQAEIAQARLDAGDAGKDEAFYTGKVAAAKFFAANVLPRLTAERAMLESTDLSLMELPEEAF